MRRLILVALLLVGLSAQAVTLPTLPQATVDTTYSLPTGGTTFTPANSAAFATALTSSVLGDVIVLTAGTTYTGPFTLPNKTTGSGWIYITSSAYSSLPSPGTRVAIADATNMPIIEVAAGSSAIGTANTAHHFRFVGIQIRPQSGNFVNSLVSLGNADTSTTTMPHHIVFDRCYIHGDATLGGRRGIAMNGPNIAVVESYLSDFKEVSADTQALWSYNSPGPIKIHNNYLEAAAENVMFGGADPNMTNLVPSDITITRNYFFKPLSWIKLTWSVKNLLEFKNAQRILVEGNLFENMWLGDQAGYLLNAKTVNQSGGCTWCIVQDLTFRYNRAKNVENGFTFGGDLSEGAAGLAPTRWLVEHSEVQTANVNGGDGYGAFNSQGGGGVRLLTHLTFRHNTILGIRADQHHLEWAATDGIINTDVDIKDNIYEGGSNGLKARTSAEGTASLDARMTNGTVTFNVWQGRSSSSYGAASGSGNTMSNNFFPVAQSNIGFVNYASGNYRLTAGSAYHNAASDGTDVGANISAIDTAIGGVTYHPIKFVLLINSTTSKPFEFTTLDACNASGKAKVTRLSTAFAMKTGLKYSFTCREVQGAANDHVYAKAA